VAAKEVVTSIWKDSLFLSRMSAVAPVQPSTAQTSNDPNSIVNLLKKSEQQSKQANSDTQFDTKKNIYEAFLDAEDKTTSIITSFLLAAGVLMLVGALLPKKK
jgi:hypothetical protein